jgi:ribosome-associated protein
MDSPKTDTPDQQPPDQDVPSKSQRKREAEEMFQLGRALVDLPDGRLKALPLEPQLLEAVLFARSIRSHGARKRQLGFLAGLLRRAELQPLLEALERQANEGRESNARHHRCEAWRDRLLAEGDQALQPLLSVRSDIDTQLLRQLIRNAQREAAANKPPASARKLFKLLRGIDEAEGLPPV